MIVIEKASLSTFKQSELAYANQNMMQSANMAQLQEKRQHISDIEYLLIKQDDQLIGQLVVVYRVRMRRFKEALVLHGPLVSDEMLQQFDACLDALESYFKKNHTAAVTYYPNLVNTRKNTRLEVIEENTYQSVRDSFLQKGYENGFDKAQATVVNQVFVKELDDFHTEAELRKSFSQMLKSNLNKYQALPIAVKELAADELEQYYEILSQTGQRKGFYVQEYAYFTELKEIFGEKAKFMIAEMDVTAYKEYLATNIQSITNEIAELQATPEPHGKKVNMKIKNLQIQLESFRKRDKEFKQLGITQDILPLSAYLFMEHGNELVSFAGGSYEEYMHFGGSTLIHWQLMKYAMNKGISRFNFYGTIETEDASVGHGNFNFKRQFGGNLEIMLGDFSKELSPLYRLIRKFKK